MKKKIILGITFTFLMTGLGIGSYFLTNYILSLNSKNKLPNNAQFDGTKRGEFVEQNKNFIDENEPTYVKLIEYKYNNQYFLGKEGLKKLNKKINKHLPFGSEIDQLKYISFNDELSLPKDINQINGQYKPFTMEMDIDVRRFVGSNSSIDDRVEFVFATILHEYGHHLANSYITANQQNDPFVYNEQQIKVASNSENLFINKFIPKSFLTKWENSLNYSNPWYEEIEKNQVNTIGYDSDIIYKDFPSRELYKLANYEPENIWKILKSNPEKKYTTYFNGEPQYQFSLKNVLKYSYGIDELLTRHLVSFNYISKNPKNYLFFNSNNRISLNSFAPDILQRNSIIKGHYFEKFSADNIFGGQMIYKEKDSEIVKKHVLESKTQQILEAYREIFGYGKLISQIFMDNSNNRNVEIEQNNKIGLKRERIKSEDFNKIKIGGYIPKNRNIKGLVLNLKNNEKIKLNIQKINSNSLKTKSLPLDLNYSNNDNEYISYISDQINFNELEFNNIENISYWEDLNNDGNLTENEIFSIKKEEIVTSRQIGTFRESFSVNVYNKGIFTHDDTSRQNIFQIKWNNNTKKIQFNKTSVRA